MAKSLLDTWHTDDAARQQSLDRARRCAALTKPPALPPQNHMSEDGLPEPFQSLGAMIVTALEGKMLSALFPPGHPWFLLQPSPSVWLASDEDVPAEDKREFASLLSRREMLVAAYLESGGLSGSRRSAAKRRRSSHFRTAMRQHLSQCIITGQALSLLRDDMAFQNFRRDQFVIRRDSSGDILRITIQEMIDPLELPREERRLAELDDDVLEQRDAHERMMPLVTQVRWQPLSGRWLVLQEMNGKVISEREEKVCSYIETPYELVSGDDEGRGFVELRLGALASIDQLHERMLDFAAILSDFKLFRGIGCQVRDEALTGRPGSVVDGAEVSDGMVKNVAMLQSNKNADYGAILNHLIRLEDNFKGTVALHQSTTPRGERVTAQQVRLVAQEVEEATGGFFVPLADSLQRPLIELAIYRAETARLMAPLRDDRLEDIHLLTGLSALAGANKIAQVLEIGQIAQAFGPEAMAALDYSVVMDVVTRYAQFYEPGFVKSPERRAQERAQAMREAVAARGADEAISVAGDAARAAIAPQ